MRATTSPRPAAPLAVSRLGFTLIELLVVISIIGILMGLLVAGVTRVREVGKRTTIVSDINNLDMAATKFKTDFGFAPPQKIRLPGVVPDPTWASFAMNSPERESYDGFQVLLRMFPRWQISGNAAVTAAAGTATGITFCSTLPKPTPALVPDPTVAQTNANGLLIEGSQCLVFFLGGPELQGFLPSGPYTPAANATAKKGPYFDFQVSRLDPSTAARGSIANGYFHGYLDSYGTPYAYFSSFASPNYDLTYAWIPPTVNPVYVNPMRAYSQSSGTNVKWVNSGGVQIISAGKNKRFGPGTIASGSPLAATGFWNPGTGNYILDNAAPGGDGGDDVANFNNGLQLGVSGS